MRARLRIAPAVVVAAGLIPSPATASETGGAAVPPPSQGGVYASFKLRTGQGYVGRPMRISGSFRPAAGRRVTIQRRRGGRWVRIARARAGSSGRFRARWRPRRGGRYRLRAVLGGTSSASQAGRRPARSRSRRVLVYRRATATYYGPGFYGRRTACGQVLRRTTIGVAHRRLPCGTRVAVAYRGRSLVVRVIDRGPFVRGVGWDLTAAAARRLGMTTTARIGVLPLTRGR